jgi:hypothetical protein
MPSTWQRFFKSSVDTDAPMLFKRTSLAGITASPPSQGILTLETLWFQTGTSGWGLVVSEKAGGKTPAGLLFAMWHFCSLTIEFEGRETQTAGSWRVCDRKIVDRNRLWLLCVSYTITVMFVSGNWSGYHSVKVPVTQNTWINLQAKKSRIKSFNLRV